MWQRRTYGRKVIPICKVFCRLHSYCIGWLTQERLPNIPEYKYFKRNHLIKSITDIDVELIEFKEEHTVIRKIKLLSNYRQCRLSIWK